MSANAPKVPVLQLTNVAKSYGDNRVLERINAEVVAGEFVSVVGASGCGKSTFLKLLLGTEQPSRGQILLDGQPLPQEPGPERGIVFQRYSVLPHLTVLGNVLVGLEMQRAPLLGKLFGKARVQALAEARAMINAVGLSHVEGHYPRALSGGMQQRLALAQALVVKPRFLLLDEPFGALDPGIRADMHQLMKRLWRDHGLTVFMITHDLKEGFSLGTRLWVFDKVRHDPQAPTAYGATITYDIPLNQSKALPPSIAAALNQPAAEFA